MMDETVEHRKPDLPSRKDGPGLATQKPGIELVIGSNIFRNTNGVVKIHGKEQIVLEPKPEHGRLCVTLDLYNEAGEHIAHVRRNVLVLNPSTQFAIEIQRAETDSTGMAPSVRILDQLSGTLAFEASVTGENKIEVSTGRFCSHKGMVVEITPHYCRIGSGMTRFGDIVENRGGTAVLG
jgi:hypothetical protein